MSVFEDVPWETLPQSKALPGPDGTLRYPGDDRFEFRVACAYGEYKTQVVHATSMHDALMKLDALPLSAWFEPEDEPEEDSHAD